MVNQLSFLFGKRFKGGPDFRLNKTWHYNLDGIDLEVTLPDGNIWIGPGDTQVSNDFPFTKPGWFDAHCEQLSNHFFVTLPAGAEWAYLGPFWKVLREPFGTLSFDFWLKRAKPGYSLTHGDLSQLEAAIRWDYEEHFEAEEPGKYSRGRNPQARKEASEMYGNYQNSAPILEQKELYIQQCTRELPNNFETREYGTQRWLYYAIQKEPNYPVHHYCQGLNEQYYLDVYFHYMIDFRNYFHIWKGHAEAAEQRLIKSVRLNFPDRLSTFDNVSENHDG